MISTSDQPCWLAEAGRIIHLLLHFCQQLHDLLGMISWQRRGRLVSGAAVSSASNDMTTPLGTATLHVMTGFLS